ncbi:hypothetical protein HED60_15080 [Planctomycetales bacterium ZRK34]|nr:hypothetical protein HED60_15080 [Planctomycetales bacterium ZRK34]
MTTPSDNDIARLIVSALLMADLQNPRGAADIDTRDVARIALHRADMLIEEAGVKLSKTS